MLDVRRRREFIVALGGAVAWPLGARAQQPAMPVIGFMSARPPGDSVPLVGAFRRGLMDGGFVEGQNVAIEYRWAHGDYARLPALAKELVDRKVAVLLGIGGDSSALAAKAATSTIPVVFGMGTDPVQAGMVASLNRPGGNVTGSTVFGPEHDVKRLELLKAIMPRLSRAAFLFNPDNPSSVSENRPIESAARSMKVEISYFEARKPAEFDAAFTAMAKRHAGGVVVTDDAMLNSNSGRIAEIAVQKRLRQPATQISWRRAA